MKNAHRVNSCKNGELMFNKGNGRQMKNHLEAEQVESIERRKMRKPNKQK